MEETSDQIYGRLKSQRNGLSSAEALERLKVYGPNSLRAPTRGKGILLFLSQFKSPLILLLIAAAILSYSLGGRADALIIFIIVLASGLLGFFQERGALNALEKILQLVENRALILRDGKETEIAFDQLVPGDIVILNAGDLIPADCVLIEAKHFFVDEASLTGESIPVEKEANHSLYLSTMVASGYGVAIIAETGVNTQYSHIAERIRFRPPETAFELGVRKLGYLLLEVTLVLVIAIFAVNIYLKKPVVDSFLFSLALAVGLTPQLLPAIISINLSHGARRMAKKHVVVKRLASIENFGQMNVLCTDKTGTLTMGKVELSSAVCADGKSNDKIALYGLLNAKFQAGYANPIDRAVVEKLHIDLAGWQKIDEIPYDFLRKRLSVVFQRENKEILISKGAVPQILSICNRVEFSDGTIYPLNSHAQKIEAYFEEQSAKGFRTLGIAYGEGGQEQNLIFLGFLCFFDPLKPGITETLDAFTKKGISLKIITGDHQSVAMHVAGSLGLTHTALITGQELRQASPHALMHLVRTKHVFAQIEPNQKEQIILALRKNGYVVGFLGDGVNDISALHSADVGIAVDSGADAAKEAADIVLMEKDLSVLSTGIEEGRTTFANTIKYVYMATSANFGNMFSMAGASLFLPFLPLLPKQVLLTNFLSDFPEMALAKDHVDPETVRRPAKWNLKSIRKFMLLFGLVSSVADYLTFGILLYWLRADQTLFRTGWLVESVVSAALIALVIRTRKLFFRSKPGRLLGIAVGAVVLGVIVLPYTALGELFGLSPMPPVYYAILAGIIGFYIASVEIAKYYFFRNHRGTK